jgi:hypothetical protein
VSQKMTAKNGQAGKPSRPVIRRECVVCGTKFTARRKDARYCAPRCRQSALRARSGQDDLAQLARRIDEAKALYWQLVQQYAEARGIHLAAANTEMSPTVTDKGEVYIRGELVGWCKPHRPGWTAWGLEAAPPPFLPPTGWADERFGRAAIDKASRALAKSSKPGKPR